MTAAGREVLYSRELLALAIELAEFPFDSKAPFQGEARSRTCGSTVLVSCAGDPGGGLAKPGLRLSACAVGQAAAAIFARAAEGRTLAELDAAEEAITHWLGGGALPNWPGIDALVPAARYPARHGAILLPWRAARDALSKAVTRR